MWFNNFIWSWVRGIVLLIIYHCFGKCYVLDSIILIIFFDIFSKKNNPPGIQHNSKQKEAKLEKMCTPKEKGGLGFQDLKTFNLALLAKQGWRLQMNSHSLVHRVLKTRYFPNTNFLHVKLGTKPSFAWQSILSAQSIVKLGYCWQVGDGKSIGVWTDCWLPRPSTFRVLTRPALLLANTMVDSFIDLDSDDWNINLINQIFLPDNATYILSIPLSRHKLQDRMIWAYTPRERFTVNNAYRGALSMTQTSILAEASHDTGQNWFWC